MSELSFGQKIVNGVVVGGLTVGGWGIAKDAKSPHDVKGITTTQNPNSINLHTDQPLNPEIACDYLGSRHNIDPKVCESSVAGVTDFTIPIDGPIPAPEIIIALEKAHPDYPEEQKSDIYNWLSLITSAAIGIINKRGGERKPRKARTRSHNSEPKEPRHTSDFYSENYGEPTFHPPSKNLNDEIAKVYTDFYNDQIDAGKLPAQAELAALQQTKQMLPTIAQEVSPYAGYGWGKSPTEAGLIAKADEELKIKIALASNEVDRKNAPDIYLELLKQGLEKYHDDDVIGVTPIDLIT